MTNTHPKPSTDTDFKWDVCRWVGVVIAITWFLVVVLVYGGFFEWECLGGSRVFGNIGFFEWLSNIEWAELGSACTGPAFLMAALAIFAQSRELKLMKRQLAHVKDEATVSKEIHEEAMKQSKDISEFIRDTKQAEKDSLEKQRQLVVAEQVAPQITDAVKQMNQFIEDVGLMCEAVRSPALTGKDTHAIGGHIRSQPAIARKNPELVRQVLDKVIAGRHPDNIPEEEFIQALLEECGRQLDIKRDALVSVTRSIISSNPCFRIMHTDHETEAESLVATSAGQLLTSLVDQARTKLALNTLSE